MNKCTKQYIVEKFADSILTQMVQPDGPDTVTFGLERYKVYMKSV